MIATPLPILRQRMRSESLKSPKRHIMTALQKVLYTAKAHTTGGREGASATDDGLLKVTLTPPKAMGGAGTGTNPEQLFASGYSACFMGAMKFVAGTQKIAVPADASIDAEVDLGPIAQGFGIAVRMAVNLPGMDRATAEKLVADAHVVCPYSNATRNNIDVQFAVTV
jgi:lipoyl-dependent peroxiredoxin